MGSAVPVPALRHAGASLRFYLDKQAYHTRMCKKV